jgi:hypothetical protein
MSRAERWLTIVTLEEQDAVRAERVDVIRVLLKSLHPQQKQGRGHPQTQT